jgi:hypothetical protein
VFLSGLWALKPRMDELDLACRLSRERWQDRGPLSLLSLPEVYLKFT